MWDSGEYCYYRDDTDGDVILDGIEDSNQDGVLDAGEMNPLVGDSDGDGLSDGFESDMMGLLIPQKQITAVDTDGDGIGDGVEDANHNGQVDAGESNPLSTDSDGDGLNDGFEDSNFVGHGCRNRSNIGGW